jgi:hypothetical protein
MNRRLFRSCPGGALASSQCPIGQWLAIRGQAFRLSQIGRRLGFGPQSFSLQIGDRESFPSSATSWKWLANQTTAGNSAACRNAGTTQVFLQCADD